MVLGMIVTKNLVLVTKLVNGPVIVTKNGFSFKKCSRTKECTPWF